MVTTTGSSDVARAYKSGDDGILDPESSFNEPIQRSSWPNSCAHPEANHVISVICGNSRLHWSVHEGFDNDFTPTMFWKTTPLEETSDTAPTGGNKKDLATKIPWLKYFPTNAYAVIGGPEFEKDKSLSSLIRYTSQKRIPYFHVYVITTDSVSFDRIPGLFQTMPCRIHQLQATDFLPKSEHPAIYPSFGVDRAATLYAALQLYGGAVLVIDGGTALTWTATNSHGKFQGAGGITLGLGIKCRSLQEYTGALPYLDYKLILTRVEECEKTKQPMSNFAGSSTEDAMLVGVLGEMVGGLTRVIEEWVALIHKEWQHEDEENAAGATANEEDNLKQSERKGRLKDDSGVKPMQVEVVAMNSKQDDGSTKTNRKPLMVVLTGGDAPILEKLLHPQYAHVLPPNERHEKIMKQVQVEQVKNLSTHGIASMLKNKAVPLNKMSNVEKLRHDLLGLRLVQPKISLTTTSGRRKQQPSRLRGTVFDIRRDNSAVLVKDLFKIKYDNGDIAVMGPSDLFDCLVDYDTMGEDPATYDGPDEAQNRQSQKERAQHAVIAMANLIPDLMAKYRKLRNDEEQVDQRKQPPLQQQQEQQLQEKPPPALVEPDVEPHANAAKRSLDIVDEDESRPKAQKQRKSSISLEQIKEIALGRSPAARKIAALSTTNQATIPTPTSSSKVLASPSSSAVKPAPRQTRAPAGAKEPAEESSAVPRQTRESASVAEPVAESSGEAVKIKQKPATSSSNTKRSSRSSPTSSSSSSKKFTITAAEILKDPKKYIHRRVAKVFDDLYFGTIVDFSPPTGRQGDDSALWHVSYDDGDEEDYDVHDMVKYLKLYSTSAHHDPKK